LGPGGLSGPGEGAVASCASASDGSTACSSPPKGRAHWTLELLADAMVKLTDYDSLSRETVREPIPAAPGRPGRFDYEYRRNGAVNLFVFLDAHRS
jgi:hypothetical protein